MIGGRSGVHPMLVRFGRFVLAGITGFLIDATVLTALANGAGWSHYAARAVSFPAAVSATWYLNRRWVFGSGGAVVGEYRRYVGCQVIGSALNLAVYVVAIESWPELARWPAVPLALGAAVALLFNYAASTLWVFRAAVRMPS